MAREKKFPEPPPEIFYTKTSDERDPMPKGVDPKSPIMARWQSRERGRQLKNVRTPNRPLDTPAVRRPGGGTSRKARPH